MIAQLCNSHGFFHGWTPTAYHHQIFRRIVPQIEEQYEGNCIVVDDTWIKKITDEDTFVTMYPNVMREDIEHIFFVNLVDPASADWPLDTCQEQIQQLTTARQRHRLPGKSKFDFWAYYCQHEFAHYNDLTLPWTGHKLFLTYNRKPMDHRVKLVNQLKVDPYLMKRGIVTLGNRNPSKALTIDENLVIQNDNVSGEVGIPNDICSLGNHSIWQQSLINVVTETIVHGNFLSEKIWKPVIGRRPFLLVGPPGSVNKLKDLGFKTFGDYWNESYNNVICPTDGRPNQLDTDESVKRIYAILSELNKLTTAQLKEIYNDMKSILNYNHTHFFNEFARDNEARIDTIVKDAQ